MAAVGGTGRSPSWRVSSAFIRTGIYNWKKQLLDGAASVLEGGGGARACWERGVSKSVVLLTGDRETLWGGRRGNGNFVAASNDGVPRCPSRTTWSRSLVALDQNSTIIAVIEMSQSSWLVAGMLPGIERQQRKKLEPNPERLLAVLHRWQDEAVRAGRTITRIALAFEAGRDGFWLARWLAARGIEAHVIHASSVAVSREHRRAKTDRLDTGFGSNQIGWVRYVEHRNDIMGQRISGPLSRREDRSRGQGVGYGAACAPARRFAVRSDVAANDGRRDRRL